MLMMLKSLVVASTDIILAIQEEWHEGQVHLYQVWVVYRKRERLWDELVKGVDQETGLTRWCITATENGCVYCPGPAHEPATVANFRHSSCSAAKVTDINLRGDTFKSLVLKSTESPIELEVIFKVDGLDCSEACE